MVSPVTVSLKQPFVKIALISIGVLILLIFLLGLYLDPIVKNLIDQQITPLFGDNLKVESIHLSIPRGIVILRNISLKQPPGFGEGYALKAGVIRMQVKLSELFHKKLIIEGLTIVRPQVNVVQLNSGKLNFDYYAASFRKSADKPRPESGEPLNVYLKQLLLKKGEFSITSSRLSKNQPAITLKELEAKISGFKLPNPERQNASFTLAGLVVAPHPAHFSIKGSGVFLSGILSYSADSQFTGFYLNEYSDLFPPSDWKIQNGVASVTAQTHCRDNYLTSHQYVKVVDLKIAPKNQNVFKSVFFGLPSKAMIALLEDQNGALDFSFDLQGSTSHLKVYLKESISHAIFRSLSKKVDGYGIKEVKPINKLKESGRKIKNKIKSLFKK